MISRTIDNTRFRYKASAEGIIYEHPKNINKNKIIRLAGCDYISQAENILNNRQHRRWEKLHCQCAGTPGMYRRLSCCIFSEKLVFEKGRVATTPFTEPMQGLFRIAWVLQGTKNKKE